jgi:DNA topoisomerase-1
MGAKDRPNDRKKLANWNAYTFATQKMGVSNKSKTQNQYHMSKNLIIVESPAKAKTIEGFLGKDYTVKSSYGHIRDLPEREMAVDIENGFKLIYTIDPEKEEIIRNLRKLAAEAEEVWLATDEDREGEAISWHLAEALKLDVKHAKRIVFHEITKKAIQQAIAAPRKIDLDLVNAQQARRVLDRLVGYGISPILWTKIKYGLSAGRVQSVAVRILVEREREIEKFMASTFFNTKGFFDLKGATLKAELNRKFANKAEAEDFLNRCKPATYQIASIETKPAKRTPAAPFTTSTLQQEASRKLGFGVTKTMTLAQRLYESGKITYMRTDSVNLSDFALEEAETAIGQMYGKNYSKRRQYTSKTKGAQEAHEAIRPTEIMNQHIDAERDQQRLYELIWKRTIASQMADAQLERTTVTIDINTTPENFIAKGEVVKFDGFLKVYTEGTDDENNDEGDSGLLPPMEQGQMLPVREIVATQRFTQKPPRYSEASLVKYLEEQGIGRPSTYASTISRIISKGYAEKTDRPGVERKFEVLTLRETTITTETQKENTGAEKSKLFPTDMGIVVNDFLVEYFPDILDYTFTARVEDELDEIAEGKLEWQGMLENFYAGFKKDLDTTIVNSTRQSGERQIGIDPASGKIVSARMGRYGPIVQIGDQEDTEKKFASLRPGQSIMTIGLEEALKLFDLPRRVGEYNGLVVTAAIGRFGPFVKWGNTFASLKPAEQDDPYTIGIERAIQLIEDKIRSAEAAILRRFTTDPEIQIVKGRFGPFIKRGRDNFRLPKGTDVDAISLDEVQLLIQQQDVAPKKGAKGSRKSATKAAAKKKAPAKKAPAKKKSAAKKSAGKK